MSLLVTVRDTAEGTLVSVCDPDCVGETYADEQVSLTVSESFYASDDAERLPVEDAMTQLAAADTANLVGERSVEAAVDAGIVDRETVLDVDGTLHAQVVWL